MGKESMISGIHIMIGRRGRRRRRGKWQQTRQRYDKSPASKIYTTWAGILSDCNIICTPRGGRKTAGLLPLGLFLLIPKNERDWTKRRATLDSVAKPLHMFWKTDLSKSFPILHITLHDVIDDPFPSPVSSGPVLIERKWTACSEAERQGWRWGSKREQHQIIWESH